MNHNLRSLEYFYVAFIKDANPAEFMWGVYAVGGGFMCVCNDMVKANTIAEALNEFRKTCVY